MRNGHRLGGRPDVDDRVLGPRRAVVVDRAAPDVDDGLAVVDDAHRRADVGAPVEVGGEHVGHGGEALVEGPLDVGHRRRNLPAARRPALRRVDAGRRAGRAASPRRACSGARPWPGAPTSTAWSGNSPRTTDAGARRRCCGRAVVPGRTIGPGAEPRAVADHHGVVGRPLLADRHVGVGVHVVLVGDVAVRPGHDVVADAPPSGGRRCGWPGRSSSGRRCAAPGSWRPGAAAGPGPCPPRGSRGRRAAWRRRARCAPRRTRRRAGTPAACRRRSGGSGARPGPAARRRRPTAARATAGGSRRRPRRATARRASRLDG